MRFEKKRIEVHSEGISAIPTDTLPANNHLPAYYIVRAIDTSIDVLFLLARIVSEFSVLMDFASHHSPSLSGK